MRLSVYQTSGSDGDRQVGVCPVFVAIGSSCKLYRLRTTSFGVVFYWVRHTRKVYVIELSARHACPVLVDWQGNTPVDAGKSMCEKNMTKALRALSRPSLGNPCVVVLMSHVFRSHIGLSHFGFDGSSLIVISFSSSEILRPKPCRQLKSTRPYAVDESWQQL